MTSAEAQAAVLSKLPEQEHYRAIVAFDFTPPDRVGTLVFELHPKYANFEAQTISVIFDNGRASTVYTTAIQSSPIASLVVGGTALLLWWVCVWRVGPRKISNELVSSPGRINLIFAHLQDLRSWHYGPHRFHRPAALYRRMRIKSTTRRLRQLPYFGASGKPLVRS